EVRNDSPFPQKIDTTLTALGEERPAARPLTIPPGGRETLAWPVTATAAGQAVSWFNAAIPAFDLVASGSTTVLPAGRESGQAWTGEADRAGALEFAIPAGADRLSAAFTLQVALSPAEAAMASLEASDTSVVAAGSGLLAATRLPGIDRKVVAAYSRRLSDTQAADGAWAWWPGLPPDAAVTAFVMRSLAAAKESGFAVPEATWRRGLDRVLAPARIPGPDPAVLADAVWACGRDVPPRVLEAAWAERGRLGIAAQARLADGLARLGDGRALSVLAGLDLASREEAGLMHWEDAAEDTVARDWDRSAVEATAWVLEARLTAGSTDDDALRVARWLLRMRRGNGWASPRAGAVAALALLHPALRVPRSGPLALTFNNRPVSLTPARGAHWLIQDGLWPGRYLLTLSQPASGAAFTATLKFYEPAVPAAPRESPAIAIDRRYYAMAVSRLARAGGKPLSELLMPQALDRERPISATVPNDRLLVSRVTVKARQGLRFVRVSDAVPGGAVAMWAARRDDHRAWTSPDGAEVRFDVPEMRPGTYDFVHAMRPRVAGTYLSPGPIAAAVHAPDIRARGAAVRLDLSR
ncbi:MAG: hypothetical protein FJZ00_03295, partial [Candidatus Sericytochromatia bacterium]|nr:hypothetical protein [Candidatus Tanganyikabacteria bacterium]